MRKPHYIGGAVLAVGAAVAIATVSIAQDPRSATSTAKPLAQWFSVLDDGAVPGAGDIQRLTASSSATEAPGTPAPSTARVAFTTPAGRPILVRGDGNTVCYSVPAIGGGCAASPLAKGPASPPVLAGGVGQSEPVTSSSFIALAGDGIETLSLDVEDHDPTTVPVRNNVVLAAVPGRVLSFSWTDPDGTAHTQRVDLTQPRPPAQSRQAGAPGA